MSRYPFEGSEDVPEQDGVDREGQDITPELPPIRFFVKRDQDRTTITGFRPGNTSGRQEFFQQIIAHPGQIPEVYKPDRPSARPVYEKSITNYHEGPGRKGNWDDESNRSFSMVDTLADHLFRGSIAPRHGELEIVEGLPAKRERGIFLHQLHDDPESVGVEIPEAAALTWENITKRTPETYQTVKDAVYRRLGGPAQFDSDDLKSHKYWRSRGIPD